MKYNLSSIKWALYALLGVCVAVIAYISLEVDNYPHKIWLHRCNSIEKLNEKWDDYLHIESDIVYRGNGVFDITHDNDKTYNLNLDSYFKLIKNSNRKMWLDIKNITEINANNMLESLDSLVYQYGIEKGNLIVESSSWKELDLFRKNGYYTSYYVPYNKPVKLTKEQLAECITEMQNIIDSKAVCAISFPGWWYKTIKEKLNRSIDLLTWKHRTTRFELLLTPEGRKMINDSQLKVILIKDKGKYHR